MANEFNVSTLVINARLLLNDSKEAYRFTENTLLAWVWEGQAEIMRRAPQYAPEGVLISETPIVSVACQQALTSYVVSRALMQDSEDGAMQRAQEHMNLFENFLKTF